MVRKNVAVVLAGAVAKGAFEAGALEELVGRGVGVRRIVAASSGGLNGTVLAAGVRAGRANEAVARLSELWRAIGWRKVFRLAPKGALGREGLSNQDGLRALLREHVRPADRPAAPVDLRFVVAPLRGVTDRLDGAEATTYEKMIPFSDASFDSDAGLAPVFDAAVASAAFPGVFTPVSVDGLGRCVDGGVVNNTPVGHALAGEVGRAVEAVVVVAPTDPCVDSPRDLFRGFALAGHLADILINERLFRDLKEAHETNAALEALATLLPTFGLSEAQREQILAAIGWGGRRFVPVIAIRPASALPGGAFSGLFDPGLRRAYLEAGRQAARDALDGKAGRALFG